MARIQRAGANFAEATATAHLDCNRFCCAHSKRTEGLNCRALKPSLGALSSADRITEESAKLAEPTATDSTLIELVVCVVSISQLHFWMGGIYSLFALGG